MIGGSNPETVGGTPAIGGRITMDTREERQAELIDSLSEEELADVLGGEELSEKWARTRERVAQEQAVRPVCRFCKGQKELRSPRNPERVVPSERSASN